MFNAKHELFCGTPYFDFYTRKYVQTLLLQNYETYLLQ